MNIPMKTKVYDALKVISAYKYANKLKQDGNENTLIYLYRNCLKTKNSEYRNILRNLIEGEEAVLVSQEYNYANFRYEIGITFNRENNLLDIIFDCFTILNENEPIKFIGLYTNMNVYNFLQDYDDYIGVPNDDKSFIINDFLSCFD